MTEQQQPPGSDQQLTPAADHGEESYRGSGKLTGKRAVITGGDSGIGKAVAIAFAREGADVLISYLPDEEDDAQDTKRWVEEAGRTAVLLPGDVSDPAYCRSVVATAVERLGLPGSRDGRHHDLVDAEARRELAHPRDRGIRGVDDPAFEHRVDHVAT